MGSNATKADRLRRKPDTFRRLTGITPEDFDQVMEDLRPLYEEAEKERLSRPDRERAIGGGRSFKLALEDRLLMLLMYYRLYTTHEFLGFLFELDDSNVGRSCQPIGAASRAGLSRGASTHSSRGKGDREAVFRRNRTAHPAPEPKEASPGVLFRDRKSVV